MPHRPNQGTAWLTPDQVRAFLRSQGVADPRTVNTVLDGYDFSGRPLYFIELPAGEVLYQYIRNPSLENGNATRSGNWFCLKGATQADVAIMGGGSGRRRYRFEVIEAFTAIEGSARPQSDNWAWAGGGPGGGTQIYVPPRLIGLLRAHGPDE